VRDGTVENSAGEFERAGTKPLGLTRSGQTAAPEARRAECAGVLPTAPRVTEVSDGAHDEPTLVSRLDAFKAACKSDVERRCYESAKAVPSAGARLSWLQRATDVLGEAARLSGSTACRVGCAHCCHIALVISESEAVALAKASGRALSRSPARRTTLLNGCIESNEAQYYGTPCPFLANDRCTAYSARPLACRLQFSLADSEDPCRIGQTAATVPYLNTIDRKITCVAILGLDERYADVRDWFPTPTKS